MKPNKKVSEVYEKLYHYTTWEGLQGILETRTLWATNYKYLNDYSEINLFRDKFISLIQPYAAEATQELIKKLPKVNQIIHKKGGLHQVVQHEVEVLTDAWYKALGNEIFILSFCGESKIPNVAKNGLLSQWRGYGTGGGAALLFDTKKLEEILTLEAKRFEYGPLFIADLVYSDDEQKLKNELSDELAIIVDIAKQFFDYENITQKKEIADGPKGYMPFVTCISRYKHYGFSEENEVRVVALPVVDKSYLEIAQLAQADGVILKPEKERKFRQKSGQHIPYIELFNSTDIELPIEKIIVGPHKEKEARATKLREKLEKRNIEIICSEIPFIG
jgi:hypothetical protein